MQIENVVRWIGDVDGFSYESTIQKIEKLIEQEHCPINLIISSEGGYLQIAMNFIEEVRIRQICLNTIVVGRVASAAVPIAMAGNCRLISRNSHLFLHNLSFWEKEEEQKEANLKEWYIRFISERSKCSFEEIELMMQKGTLIGPQKAVDDGFVHGTI